MNSLELDRILRRNSVTRKVYCGVHPSDQIPVPRHYPCAMVVNLDDSSEPGTHWVAMYMPNKQHVKYYDSFGEDLFGDNGMENIKKYVNKHFLFVSRPNFAIQNPKSNTCGFYTLYFIYMSALRVPFYKIQNRLARLPNPDSYVKNFVLRNMLSNH